MTPPRNLPLISRIVPRRSPSARVRWTSAAAARTVALVGCLVASQAGLVGTVTAATGHGSATGATPSALATLHLGDNAVVASAPTRTDPFDGMPAPADAPPAQPAGAAGGAQPTIQYEEAVAHEGDPDTFTPGDRVTVPFTPRSDDGWAVGGGAPLALPIGNATGRAMALAVEGSRWATSAPMDLADRSAGAIGPSPAGTDSAGGASSLRSLVAEPAVAIVPGQAPDQTPGAASGLRRQVFGFLPYWTLGDSSTVLDYDLLSTIAYFSVGADAQGNLLKRNRDGSTTTGWGGWTSSRLTSVINAAHAHHTRVVLTISVFAWSGPTKQASLLGSPAARLNLARQAAAAVRDRGADGINLDFEPIVSGHADDFTALVRTFRAELNKVHKGYQLTFDTTGYIGNYPIEDATAPGAADAIFIMGYDYRTSGAATAGSTDPLRGPGYTLEDTIRAYTARVSPSKLILGLPYYGRAWSTTSNAVRAPNQSGSKYGTSNAVVYGDAVALAHVYGRLYDPTEQTAWFAYRRKNCTAKYGCVTSWREVYYDDAQSLKARYDLVVRSRLRGSGIWALGYDGRDHSLYGAISLKYLHDTTAPEAGIAVLPATTHDAGFVVTWRALDDSAIKAYDVQVSVDGGAWAPWLTATKATSDVYLGADGHGYAFRVRATDAYHNVSAWDVSAKYDPTPSVAIGGFGRVKVDVSARVGPGTSSLKVATLSAGQVVAVIGGPVSADGYTWYEITGPLSEWNTVAFTRSGVWAAFRSASTTYIGAALAPDATLVDAGIDRLTLGDGSPGPAFSPNGDGSKDKLHVTWRNHVALDSIELRAYRLDGTLVGARAVDRTDAGDQAMDWDGGLTGVAALPDGRYVIQLVGTAGGATYNAPSIRPVTPVQVARFSMTIDRVAPTVTSASISARRISPNGDGRFDTIHATLATKGGGVAWDLLVSPVAAGIVGAPVRTIVGTGASAAATWNGKADAGTVVPNGTYRLSLRVIDRAGNRAVRAWNVIVDARPAVIATAASPAFSPNADGVSDRLAIHWSSDEKVTGTVAIRHGTHLVRAWSFTSKAGGAITWDGRDAAGHSVASGTYRIRVDARDATGNRTVVERTIVIDRTVGFLRWSSAAFDPSDGDALAPTSRVSFTLTRSASASLVILDSHGLLVRTIWSGKALTAGVHGWKWDGRLQNGQYVTPGSYTAILTVVSSLGTTVLRRTVFVGAFIATTPATTLHAGQTLSVAFRTVEPLRSRPVATFRQAGHAAVTKSATRLANGTYRVTFAVRTGSGPASVTIDAVDTGGHRNRQTLVLTVA